MFVKPWSKESERILRQLSFTGRASIIDNNKLPREFGMKCKDILDQDFLDIATIRNKKIKRTWFITPPDVTVVPKPGDRGINFHFKRFKIL